MKPFSWKKFTQGLPRLTPAGKKAFLKYGGFLLLIILGFSLLSRVLTHSGQTLSQYGEANPSLQENNSVSGGGIPSADSGGQRSDNGTAGSSTDDRTAGGDKDGGGNDGRDGTGGDNRTPEADGSTGTAADGGNTEYDTPDGSKDTDGGETENKDNAWKVSEDGLTGNGGTESPDRVTYKPDFYYEPLSENLIGYITGSSYPADGSAEISLSELHYVHILHYNFEGEAAEGELICNSAIAQDLVEIFYELYIAEYRLESVLLIDYYDADDVTSMEANNTSCFNYRNIDDTDKLSRHAFGLAIDVNPFYNPYIRFTKDGGQIVSPESSAAYVDRTQSFPYKIDADDLCCRLFLEHGFTWGGNWNSSKDYQHFQKIID